MPKPARASRSGPSTPYSKSKGKRNAATPRRNAATPRKNAATPRKQPWVYVADIWKGWKTSQFFAGTELFSMDEALDDKWNFNHAYTFLQNKGGVNFDKNKRVFLFGQTEPLAQPDDDTAVDLVPAICAIVADLDPEDISQVAIASIQKANEEIRPMKKNKMGWVEDPNFFQGDEHNEETKIFGLQCSQRTSKSVLKQMSEADIAVFTYIVPYIWLPEIEANKDPDTMVDCLYTKTYQGKEHSVRIHYNFGDQTVAEAVDEFIDDNEPVTCEADEGPMKEVVRAAIKAKKEDNAQLKDRIAKRLAEMAPEKKKALEDMKVYKFYPLNEHPGIQALKNMDPKNQKINRYYGPPTMIL
eukprot:TRINITY_DN14762_c0_g1_i1.p1 TRINITY_DN14762_c0_g1~~TRINITY_DN14762_c0_g1_i1.p1  ORF type:complete len:367 (-),score=94.13 TRINITY_DN14762_c0_g1_i1:303-1370(-)